MILYVHTRIIPLNTFLVNADAKWTVSRVRGYLLHKLAEVGHHRHPFRLKWKEKYLKDTLTLEECGILDAVSIELVFLATIDELRADLYWRYIYKSDRDEPHLVALQEEVAIFKKRESWLLIMKVLLMFLYPICVLDFFLPGSPQKPFWIWAFAQFIYAFIGLYYAPGYSYLSGWVGKEKNIIKRSIVFDYFSLLAICSAFTLFMNLLCLGLSSELNICSDTVLDNCIMSSVPKVYSYIVLGLSAAIIICLCIITVYLHLNSKTDQGEIIEKSLTRFKSVEEIRKALTSSDVAEQRAAAFELSTAVRIGESDKYYVLENALLLPLSRLCLSPDSHTQDHATETISELLTLQSIQEHYMVVCDATDLSQALVRPSSLNTKIEVLKSLVQLSNSDSKQISRIINDIISYIDMNDTVTEQEYLLVLVITRKLIEHGSQEINLKLATCIAKLLARNRTPQIISECLDCIDKIMWQNPVNLCSYECLNELFAVSSLTTDGQSLELIFCIIRHLSEIAGTAEYMLCNEIADSFCEFIRSNYTEINYQNVLAVTLSNLCEHSHLTNKCLETGIDVLISDFLKVNLNNESIEELLFNASTQLEIMRKRLVRQNVKSTSSSYGGSMSNFPLIS